MSIYPEDSVGNHPDEWGQEGDGWPPVLDAWIRRAVELNAQFYRLPPDPEDDRRNVVRYRLDVPASPSGGQSGA